MTPPVISTERRKLTDSLTQPANQDESLPAYWSGMQLTTADKQVFTFEKTVVANTNLFDEFVC